MGPVGRERRRKGPINRLRRFMYGMLLAAAVPGAAAADELGQIGKYKPRSIATAVSQGALEASIEGLLVLHAERAAAADAAPQGNAYPRIALDSVNARIQQPLNGEAHLLKVDVTSGGTLRDGVGFDMLVPDFGRFHLNLYSRRNARTEGKRWSMNLTDGSMTPMLTRSWSLGGSLELVRTIDGDRQFAMVPELLLNVDALTGGKAGFTASVKYGNWRSVSDKRSLDDKVPQLTFRWRL
jgi:hypothetical protein